MFTEEKKVPEYYKFKLQNEREGEFCLATRFTVQNATNETWPVNQYKADAVRFEGEGYYSRFLQHGNCRETGETLYTTHTPLYYYRNILDCLLFLVR